MQTPEEKLYFDAVAEFQTAFPAIPPPDGTWFAEWLIQYGGAALSNAIQKLQRQNPHVQARFTTESTGRAISAHLRAAAIKRAAQKMVRP